MLFSSSVDDSLKTELDAYRRLAYELRRHVGEYVVLKGDAILGFYATFEAALEAGYEKYDLDAFLVKEITTDPRFDFSPAELDLHGELPPFQRHPSSLRTSDSHHDRP